MLGQRLKELRKEKSITQTELGKIINVGKSTISQYESGVSRPDYDTLNHLADFFNVSTDYLLGRTNIRETANNINLPRYFSKYTGQPIDLDRPFKEKTLADALLVISELTYEFDMPDELFTALLKKAKRIYGPPGGVGGKAAHGPNMPGTLELEEDDK